jgi:hypothetical protein
VFKALHHHKEKNAANRPAPHHWLENIGLIVIVGLILAITITRYWHNIHWSLR